MKDDRKALSSFSVPHTRTQAYAPGKGLHPAQGQAAPSSHEMKESWATRMSLTGQNPTRQTQPSFLTCCP